MLLGKQGLIESRTSMIHAPASVPGSNRKGNGNSFRLLAGLFAVLEDFHLLRWQFLRTSRGGSWFIGGYP